MILNLLKKYKKNIATRLLLNIFLFSSVVTLIITAVQLNIEYQRDIEGIEDQFTRIEEIFQKPLTRALWFFNENSLKLQLEGISNLRDIEYLELIGENDVFIAVGKKISKKNVINELPLIHKGNISEREIGRLNIVASLSSVYSRLYKRMITILISQGIKTFLVSTFIFFIVHYLVIKHLIFLNTYLRNLKAGKPTPILRLRRNQSPSDDELDQMVFSINDMAERQHKTFEEIEQIVKDRTTILDSTNNQLKHEISDRRLAEEARWESETRFKTMFEQAPLGVALIDSFTGQIYEVNPRFAEIAGRTIDKMSTIDWMSITHPDDVQEDLDNMAALNAGKITGFTMNKRYLHPDGSYVWIMMTIAPLKETEQNHKQHLCMIDDITQQIHAEEEKTILEDRLRQSQKMQAVGTLAGGIAHEFNNLLGVIMGCADMARDETPKDSFAKVQLDKVMKASYRVKDLVKQILTFSRQSQQQRISANLCPLVKESVKLIQSSIPSSVETQINIVSAHGNTLVDPTEIQQIVMNFCSNAVWAMKEQGILTINLSEVNLTNHDKLIPKGLSAGSYLKLSFRDTGCGMDQKTVSQIFDPFFTTKEVGQGTGMGLAIVYGIITSYGGTITVESEVGTGTTFHLYFPVTDTPATEEHMEEEGKDPGGTERILFVDDQEMYAEMGEDMISRLGYDVDLKIDSTEALGVFKAGPEKYDLVITDQIMPDLSGEELVKEIRSIRPEIPIILCTGYSTQMDEKKAESLGINAFAYKPIVKKDIAMLIRKVLDTA